MKSKSLILIAITALLGVGIFSGCARSIEARSEHMMWRVTGDLDLTKDQQAALNAIRLDIIKKVKDQKDAMVQLKNEFVTLIKSDVMDPAKVQQLKTKMQALHQEIQDSMTAKLIEFHKTLTAAQKSKIADKIEFVSKKMQELLE